MVEKPFTILTLIVEKDESSAKLKAFREADDFSVNARCFARLLCFTTNATAGWLTVSWKKFQTMSS